MSPHDICGKIWNSPHLACVWCRKRRHICKIYAIFLKKSVLWKFTHFVAKSILLQFTHFCVEKNLSKNFLRGEKWQISGLFSICFFPAICGFLLVPSRSVASASDKTSQELRMLSTVTLNCQVTKIVLNSGSQLSELQSVSQMSQVCRIELCCLWAYIAAHNSKCRTGSEKKSCYW